MILIVICASLCLCLDEDQDDFFNDLRREKSIKENVFEHFKKRYDDRKKDREDTVERHRISRQDKNPFDFLPRMKFKPVKNTFIHHEVNDLRKMIKAKMHQKRNHYDKSYHDKKRQNDTQEELDRSEKIEDPILKTIELYLNKIITEDIEDLNRKESKKSKDVEVLTTEAKKEKILRRGRQDSSFDSSSSTEDPIISFLSGNIANLDDYEKFHSSHYYGRKNHNKQPDNKKADKISLLRASDSEILRRGKQESEFSGETENDSDSESHGYPRHHQSRLPALTASGGGRNQFKPNFPSVSKLPREVKILLLQDLSFSIS